MDCHLIKIPMNTMPNFDAGCANYHYLVILNTKIEIINYYSQHNRVKPQRSNNQKLVLKQNEIKKNLIKTQSSSNDTKSSETKESTIDNESSYNYDASCVSEKVTGVHRFNEYY